MNREDEIRLREWWLQQLKRLTKELIDAEAKRTEREKLKAKKMLGDYRTYNDIQDAYAYGAITEAKRDKLMDLLEKESFNPEEDRDYRMRMDFLQEDYQRQKEILAELKPDGEVYWA